MWVSNVSFEPYLILIPLAPVSLMPSTQNQVEMQMICADSMETTDFWLEVYNYSAFLRLAEKQIFSHTALNYANIDYRERKGCVHNPKGTAKHWERRDVIICPYPAQIQKSMDDHLYSVDVLHVCATSALLVLNGMSEN